MIETVITQLTTNQVVIEATVTAGNLSHDPVTLAQGSAPELTINGQELSLDLSGIGGGGGGAVDSVNGQTGVVVLNTDDIAEGATNKYYTEARVSANADVAANTAKTGITPQQAADIVANNAKISATGNELQPSDIDTLAKVNVIITDATLIDSNDPRLSDSRTPTAHTHTASEISDFDAEVSNNVDVVANTAKVSYTDAIQVASNTFSRHDAVTLAPGSDAELSLSGQQLSLNLGDVQKYIKAYLTQTQNVNPTHPFTSNEHIYTFKGQFFRTYFAWADPTYQVYVNYYDWDSQLFGTPVEWGGPGSGLTDNHALPAIVLSADGHIILAQERLGTSGGSTHNSPIHIRRSNNPEDISAWTEVAGSPFSEQISYLKFVRFPNGRIQFFARWFPDGVESFISDDHGVTWTNFDGTAISSVNGNNPWVVKFGNTKWAYNKVKEIPGGAYMTIRQRLPSGGSYPLSFALFTRDGLTWGNLAWFTNQATGQFFKNTTIASINDAELRNNCLAAGDLLQDDNGDEARIRNTSYQNGYLSFVYRYALNGGAYEYRFRTIDPKGNIYGDTDIISSLQEATTEQYGNSHIIPINSAIGHFRLLIKELAGELCLYETTDYGVNWIKTETLTNDGQQSDILKGYGYYDHRYNIHGISYANSNTSFGLHLRKGQEIVHNEDFNNKVSSDNNQVVGADIITNMIALSQAEYDAIVSPDSNTLYIIT